MIKKPKTNLPVDRSHLETEQRNKRSMQLHKLSVADCVKVINKEDHKVFDAMQKAEKSITGFIENIVQRFTNGGRLIYIGAGTSGRLGVLDAAEIPPTFQADANRIVALIAGGPPALRTSSEGKEDNPKGSLPALKKLDISRDDTILGIAAGGTTPYVLGAFDYAKKIQPQLYTGFLTCTAIPKPPNVDHLICIETGPEILTGSTRMKAGTATKLALNTISTTLMIYSGKVYENLMVDLKATNNKLMDRATRIVSTLTNLNRNESFDLITKSNGSVKTAIVMYHGKTSSKKAEALLEANEHRLDETLKALKK